MVNRTRRKISWKKLSYAIILTLYTTVMQGRNVEPISFVQAIRNDNVILGDVNNWAHVRIDSTFKLKNLKELQLNTELNEIEQEIGDIYQLRSKEITLEEGNAKVYLLNKLTTFKEGERILNSPNYSNNMALINSKFVTFIGLHDKNIEYLEDKKKINSFHLIKCKYNGLLMNAFFVDLSKYKAYCFYDFSYGKKMIFKYQIQQFRSKEELDRDLDFFNEKNCSRNSNGKASIPSFFLSNSTIFDYFNADVIDLLRNTFEDIRHSQNPTDE